MTSRLDEIFYFDGRKLTEMPSRSMREGLLGKTLEDALQTFFEKYPQIIPGKQIDPISDDPPYFVLLRREMPVGGWSLDHLFVDQHSILTLVETKLFQNPESRREVIGQIIEYAANAIEAWAGGGARQKATEFWGNQSPPKEIDALLMEEFGEELDIDDFWRKVEENLTNKKIRLIIASDNLRPEIRRMIEYLNDEMKHTDIFGLELKFYGGEKESVLVPRLVGQSQSTIDKKGLSKTNVIWTEEKLKSAYRELTDNFLVDRLDKILDWSLKRGYFFPSKSIKPSFRLKGSNKKPFITINHDGNIYIILRENCYLGNLIERNKLVSELKNLNLLNQDFMPDSVKDGRYLTKKIMELSNDELDNLLNIFNKYCN